MRIEVSQESKRKRLFKGLIIMFGLFFSYYLTMFFVLTGVRSDFGPFLVLSFVVFLLTILILARFSNRYRFEIDKYKIQHLTNLSFISRFFYMIFLYFAGVFLWLTITSIGIIGFEKESILIYGTSLLLYFICVSHLAIMTNPLIECERTLRINKK